MSNLGKSGANWGKKKSWGAKVFRKEDMECETNAGSDESKSTEFKRPSLSPGWKKDYSKSPIKKDYSQNKSFGSFQSSGPENSEEDDKQALYDIIHNMVDRILDNRSEKEFESESSDIISKKQKMES